MEVFLKLKSNWGNVKNDIRNINELKEDREDFYSLLK